MTQSFHVNGPTRRIYLYWILLLVPTLLVGAGALLLLQREEGRLAARAGQVDQARRAALQARAQLAAENVELIVGDVENGLLASLLELPAEALVAQLQDFEKSNPLVHATFLCSETGRLVRPGDAEAGEAARGFRRRFSGALLQNPPWSAQAAARAGAPAAEQEGDARKMSEAQDKPVLSYAENVQRARRDVQALSKQRSAEPVARPRLSSSKAAVGLKDSLAKEEVAAAPQNAAAPVSAPASVVAVESQASDKQGWLPLVVENRLFLLGWAQPAGKDLVRGVELDLSALVARLGPSLPLQLGAGEGLCLRDEKGRVLHQVGLVDLELPFAARVPVNSRLLPGWTVDAYVDAGSYRADSGGAFLLVSGLLVGIFVVAILAGGSLLLWQARRSALDSVQKTSFVANVSHELKTPLTTIRLYAELLEQGRVAEESKRTVYLRTIGRETERLARLVNNVLDFSRLEQGRKAFKLERVELVQETKTLVGMLEPRAVEAGLRLEWVCAESSLVVLADRDAFGQIFLNLADNAFKYASSGGELSVEVRWTPSGLVAVHVCDRGPGVPAALREKVFEKFYRIDESLTAEKAGAGLGLSIARQLARAMGGELRCLPREGGGAEFVLSLPAV